MIEARLRRACALVVVAACHPAAAPAAASAGPAQAAPPTAVAPLAPGPGTAVVTLAPDVPTPVLDGPFLVTTINPGSSMDLAVASSHDCGDAKLAWFAYSGGGVAVGRGQTLCARSQARGPRTNGFSGHD